MLERIEAVLKRARVAGGGEDDVVARDVLRAMREPTETMIKAAFWEDGEATARNVWREMIADALGNESDAVPDETQPG